MNHKTLTALGCLTMIAAAMAPSALAHTQGSHPGPLTPPASSGPAGWYTGAAAGYAGFTTTTTVGGQAQGVCASVTDPQANAACNALLSPVNPGFTFAVANSLCDMEVQSDGSQLGAAQDEGAVDSVVPNTGGMLPDGTFNDGGLGAACHTYAAATSDPSVTQDGYYAQAGFNTGGCNGGHTAVAADLVAPSVWIEATCDDVHTLSGPGLVTSLTGCVTGAVLTVNAVGAVGCVTNAVNCLTGAVCANVGAVTECGADGTADVAGAFGAGSSPFPNADSDSDSPADNCDNYGAAAVFVFNGVDVDQVNNVNTVSAATHGYIA